MQCRAKVQPWNDLLKLQDDEIYAKILFDEIIVNASVET